MSLATHSKWINKLLQLGLAIALGCVFFLVLFCIGYILLTIIEAMGSGFNIVIVLITVLCAVALLGSFAMTLWQMAEDILLRLQTKKDQ